MLTATSCRWRRTLAISVTHAFVSVVPDDPASASAGEVLPSHWNAGHSLSGTASASQAIGLGLQPIRAVRVVTAAGDVTVDSSTDDIVIVKKTSGAATGVTLPSAGDRSQYRPIKIVDGKLDAATNNITITPSGAETIVGLSTYVISFDGGSVELWPLPDGTAWYI